MNEIWMQTLSERLDETCLMFDIQNRTKYSKDYSFYSPVLERDLKDKIADCIAAPRTIEQLKTIISTAYEFNIPITPRGCGTGNYGQCVPLTGGIVIDFTNLNRVLDIQDGRMTVESGIKMGKMEDAARQTGQEMRILPSTFQTSSIAGFISGGIAGKGSINWGMIWDGFILSIQGITLEKEPKTFMVEGPEIQPYLHTYGAIGMITEITVSLVPKVEWEEYAVAFTHWSEAMAFSISLSNREDLNKRLISCQKWPTPSYHTPLKLPIDKSIAFVELDSNHRSAFLEMIEGFGGEVAFYKPKEQYHKKLGISDFTFGHTLLWVKKKNPNMTYIQLGYDQDLMIEQSNKLQEAYPDMLLTTDIVRRGGALLVTGAGLFPFVDEEHIDQLIHTCNEIGIHNDNPHVTHISLVRKKWNDSQHGINSEWLNKLRDLKQQNDPANLLNQKKLILSEVEFNGYIS